MFLSKEVVLKAYYVLSSLSEAPVQQGATQKISAIRYLFALDAFLKQTGRQYCDVGLQSDKQDFSMRVADVVNVTKDLYTTAFYHPLVSHNGDCNTGSNFFSAGQVKASTINTHIDCPYPKRSGWPALLTVRSGRISIFRDEQHTGYSNLKWYLNDEKHCAALFVWLSRNWDAFSTVDTFVSDLKRMASEHYSNELLQNLFPSDSNFATFISAGEEFIVEIKPNLTAFDIKNLFVKNESKQIDSKRMVPQLITYGAPGTGKSHGIEEVVGRYADTVRTTFHPDSDYASFVGCYKPTVAKRPKYGPQGLPIKVNGIELTEDIISYSYVPQAFTKAYIRAWSKLSDLDRGDEVKCQFLIIEEINRGNCAQIFGDLFQLLDRRGDGYSKYPIEADADLARYIEGALKALSQETNANIPPEVLSGKKLILPPNLYIWATMNTSDQSLFPMDSAFKRRWDWKYIPIKDAGKNWKIVADGQEFRWWDFLEVMNKSILEALRSEDKQLGYFFARPDDDTSDVITASKFVNKVLFYLYNDVFKDYELPKGFTKTDGGKFAFADFFLADGEPNETAVKDLLSGLVPLAQPLEVPNE